MRPIEEKYKEKDRFKTILAKEKAKTAIQSNEKRTLPKRIKGHLLNF
jgi:hypothetical protein